jgi:hypothetical protein
MERRYPSLQVFIDEVKQHGYTMDKCTCGGSREMTLSTIPFQIDGKSITLIDCPILTCQKCGDWYLGNSIAKNIVRAYKTMNENGEIYCRMTSQNNVRYSFAESAGFIYDSRDLCIPALDVDLDHPDTPGFSCPVFFDRKVLNAFLNDDDYELNFASESYGTLAKVGTREWSYDWHIVFGINKYDHVIMFLGDLDTVCDDLRAISILKAYNIESDHTIVETELYQAQFNSVFSEPIKEARVIKLRDSFFRRVEKKTGIRLHHLEMEVETKAASIAKPINFNERELRENIVLLDGVLNEGIDCAELRKLVQTKAMVTPKNIQDLKTRKLLIELIKNEGKDEKAANELVSPLFVLNDLRGVFSHVLPAETVENYKKNAVKSLSLTTFDDYRSLYDALIDKLYILYRFLAVSEIAG